ncbi:hypothetical protein [Barnesiella intestinihominis]|uniref:hypothetical protein n=1 Tax=Barnesiella intestinihominis TaxID=487174 RepID=UPI003967C394
MSAEIERKYTVKDQSYRQESIECKYYKQGYISIDKERTVRIRISGNNAFITLKVLPQVVPVKNSNTPFR